MKTAIQELDVDVLAPVEIWEVMLDHSTIKFHQPLVLTPTRMLRDSDEPDEVEEVEYMEVEMPKLGISAFGEDRRELLSVIRGDIRMAWKYIVCVEDEKLSTSNLAVKRNYLAIAEEIIDG
jgi:hypothetical protein